MSGPISMLHLIVRLFGLELRLEWGPIMTGIGTQILTVANLMLYH